MSDDGSNFLKELRQDSSNGEHIASWHPVVALAVADWLDAAAGDGSPHDGDFCCHACNVARAYLGGVL